jgi:hypothetical protein
MVSRIHLKIGLLASLLFLFLGCEKESLKKSDYLIFGSFYGECLGEGCIETFLVTNDDLYEDIKGYYPLGNATFFEGDWQKLDKKLFRNVDLSSNDIPTELLNTESGKDFGCPDCADGGGIYLEYKVGNTHKFWVIDNMKYHVPEYLHPLMDKIRGEILKINE